MTQIPEHTSALTHSKTYAGAANQTHRDDSFLQTRGHTDSQARTPIHTCAQTQGHTLTPLHMSTQGHGQWVPKHTDTHRHRQGLDTTHRYR